MNLVLDLGNTQSKLAIFEADKLVQLTKVNKTDLSLELVKEQFNSCDSGIISTVITLSSEINSWVDEKKMLILNENTPLPIVNKYRTPHTLGKDRIANAVGANLEFPNNDVLIIDFGTCLKYDFISRHAIYEGGAISLGRDMRYKSLNHFTDHLPLETGSSNALLIGNDTRTSIISGVEHGIIKEVQGIIKDYHSNFTKLLVIFTGGNHEHFVPAFKNTIFARPNLTLSGLNRILEFNGE